MVMVYIGLGSNLQDPLLQVKKAIQQLKCLPLANFIAASKLYHTQPVGPIEQPDYVNAVVQLETDLAPAELLLACDTIETQQGRRRLQKWGPRVIDLDILLYGEQVINSAELVIPHPEMKKRRFVLEPLSEIAPDFVLPSGETVNELLLLI